MTFALCDPKSGPSIIAVVETLSTKLLDLESKTTKKVHVTHVQEMVVMDLLPCQFQFRSIIPACYTRR